MMKLAYWGNCRGLAHPIRMLLEYCGAKYEYSSHECGLAPYFDKKEWYSSKYEILTAYDFPNLPYLKDVDTHLTHYVAIMQYLGRKYDLYPVTEQEHQDVDMLREQVAELKEHLVNTMYFFGHRKKGIIPTMDEILSKRATHAPSIQINISDIARKYRKQGDGETVIWMAGNRITYVDFLIYEQVDYARNLFPELLDSDEHCPIMKKFMEQFEHLPNISSYMKSERFNKFPFYGERSYLGRSEETCYKDMKCSFTRNNWF